MPFYGSYRILPDDSLMKRVIGSALTPDEVDEHRSVTLILDQLSPLLSSYECALRSGNELISTISDWNDRVRKAATSISWTPSQSFEAFYAINHKAISFLSCTRAFLDHTPRNLVKSFGPKSAQLDAFNACQRRLYDANFGYRFMATLRNYAQHKDLPVTFTQMKKTRSVSKGSMMSISYAIDRDVIASDSNVKSSLREEIKQLDPLIDPIPYFTDQHRWNREIFAALVDHHREQIIACRSYFDTLHQKHRIHPNEVLVIWKAEGEAELEYAPISYDLLARLNSAMLTQGPVSFIGDQPLSDPQGI